MLDDLRNRWKNRGDPNRPASQLGIVELLMALEEAGLRPEKVQMLERVLEGQRGRTADEIGRVVTSVLTKDDFIPMQKAEKTRSALRTVTFWLFMIFLAIVLWTIAASGGTP